ncbi:SRPBCC family protein [Roseovarius ramblicola]|uniref:SRPBCC family protein n=1 Tax=Roseovarius ramblicola TaxID=2022336 RepID=A0ABV5I020_9RHOB
MQFTGKEDIEAPIDAVFAEITDFTRFERSAMRRGAEVQRTDSMSGPGVGMTWHARFRLRGRMREIDLRLTGFEPPDGIVIAAEAATIEAVMRVDLMSLSRTRTRLSVDLAVSPRNLAGRLMIQSMKLARGKFTKRFRLRLADYAMDVEDRHKRSV